MLGQKWTNPGELTGMGQRMHYLLGLRNRIKYIKEQKFLSENYDPHEILIFSSAINRTILSASSQLQGLYPIKDELGLVLTEEQEKISVPQVSIDYSEIETERKNLGLNALPHLMTLVPVRLINDNDRKINVYDLTDCKDEREEVKSTNLKNLQAAQDFVKNFNTQYGERVNKYFGTSSSEEYDIVFIYDLCDAFVSDYTDRRDLSDFKSAGIDLDEFHEYCMDYMKLNFLYYFFGDEEKALARLDSSKLMTESIYFMKNRVDADINGINIDENFNDYSKPKWVMISGHDSTSSSDEVFMLYALGYNLSDYKFPKFANQIALEVARKDDGTKKTSYSDYFVKCYFNDDLLFNVTLDVFIEKIQDKVWSDEKISEYCGFEDKEVVINYVNNGTVTTKKKSDKAKTAYKVLMSIFICTTAILLATTIALAYKLSQKNDSQYRNNVVANTSTADKVQVNKFYFLSLLYFDK